MKEDVSFQHISVGVNQMLAKLEKRMAENQAKQKPTPKKPEPEKDHP